MFEQVQHLSSEIDIKASRDSVKERLISFILLNEGKIESQAGFNIKAKFGSNLRTRFLGTALGGYKKYPVEVILSIFQRDEGSRVAITARDALGFGTRIGMGSNIQQALLYHIENIKDSLRILE